MSDRVLLAVFAHPDDESFGPGGTLARYAAEGVAVHLVCATRGEAGLDDTTGPDAPEPLARRRERELGCAAGVLGLREVHLLDYHDSGMPGSPSNRHPRALMRADPRVLAEQVGRRMRQVRAQVVITFDPHGGYGHPDHVTIHRATLAAFEQLPQEERPQKLYFTTFNLALMRWMVRLMPLLGIDPSAVGKNRDINLQEAARRALPVTTRVDVSDYLEVKQRAAACHSSQLAGPDSIFGRLPRWVVRHWQSTESFYRVVPVFRCGERVERDLFAGINPWAAT